MILQIPWEIREQIVVYCNISDVKNLALASSLCNKTFKDLLFYAVKVPLYGLQDVDLDKEKVLHDFRHTKILRVGETFDDYGNVIQKFSWANLNVDEKERLDRNFQRILEECNPQIFQVQAYLPKKAVHLMSKFDNLIEIQMRDNIINLHDSLLESLGERFTRLKLLDLRNSRITDGGLKNISTLVSLERLHIGDCNITDVTLYHASTLARLKELDLRECVEITDLGISEIVNLIKLTHLDIARCLHITDKALLHISHLYALEYLDVSQCIYLTDNGMMYLSKLKCMIKLGMNGCMRITDAGVLNLGFLPRLARLDMALTDVTDLSLSHMCNFPALEILNVMAANVSNGGLKYLKQMKSLKFLYFMYTEITEDGLRGSGLSELLNRDIRVCR